MVIVLSSLRVFFFALLSAVLGSRIEETRDKNVVKARATSESSAVDVVANVNLAEWLEQHLQVEPQGNTLAAPLHAWLGQNVQLLNLTILDAQTKEEKAPADIHPLGVGSFGEAYLARGGHGFVVLKVAKDIKRSSDLMQECEKAMRIADAIKAGSAEGFHIAQCLEKHPEAKPPFIVLQYAGEIDGSKMLSQGTENDPKVLLGYIKQVLFALAALADAKPPQIHHDLKWANVVISDRGCLRLIDLDTVLEGTLAEYESPRVVVSTRAFRPPEVTESIQRAQPKVNSPITAEDWLNPSAFHNFEACFDSIRSCTHSFDVFSLGVMAFAGPCGFAELAEASLPNFDAVIQQNIVAYAKIGRIVSASSVRYALGVHFLTTGMASARQSGEDLSVWLLKKRAELLTSKTEATNPQLHNIVRKKLDYCSCSGAFPVLDRMVDASPDLRPTPGDLLASRPFKSIRTGCDADSSAEEKFVSDARELNQIDLCDDA